MPSASTASVICSTRSTFGQPDRRSRISPRGATWGTVEQRCPGLTARRMSIREMTVPKSLDVQRTKAKMLPGANDSTRRWRSIFRSSMMRPNRMRFSIRFSSHSSSTSVRAACRRSRRPEWGAVSIVRSEAPVRLLPTRRIDGPQLPVACEATSGLVRWRKSEGLLVSRGTDRCPLARRAAAKMLTTIRKRNARCVPRIGGGGA
ncbi:hypothetical protein ACVWZL_008941 [Bradyrhizobium sp. GM2.4]